MAKRSNANSDELLKDILARLDTLEALNELRRDDSTRLQARVSRLFDTLATNQTDIYERLKCLEEVVFPNLKRELKQVRDIIGKGDGKSKHLDRRS